MSEKTRPDSAIDKLGFQKFNFTTRSPYMLLHFIKKLWCAMVNSHFTKRLKWT